MPLVYQGRIYQMHQEKVSFPDGREKTFEILHHPGAAAVVPIHNEKKSILLIKQFRPVVQKWIWEIPAGMLDKNEDPLVCAERELKEETGWIAEKFKKILEFNPSQGYCNEVIHIFQASLLKEGPSALEETELVEPHLFSFEHIQTMLQKKEITDPKTVLGLMHVLNLFKAS